MNRRNIIPIFVPHLGCPHDCIFCNQKKITGYDTDISRETVHQQILEYLSYFKHQNNIEVAFYGGSFTAMSLKLQQELLSEANEWKEQTIIQSIRLSTRPDAISPKILEMLQKYHVDTIELGVQSLNPEVLMAAERGHDTACVYHSAQLIRQYGFSLGLQQMVGLPKDNYEKSMYTAREFIRIRPDFVRIYPVLVIKNTKLEQDYLMDKYLPLTVEQSLPWVGNLLVQYEKANIDVIRIGLQVTDTLQLGKDVLAGPFHPAYGQLVMNRIYINAISNYFQQNRIQKTSVTIWGNGRDISNLVGQKSIGRKQLMNNFQLSKVAFLQKNLPPHQLLVQMDEKIKQINIKDYFIMENLCI